MTASPALPAFERALARAMLAGVWLSAAVLAGGLLLAMAKPHTEEGQLLLRGGLVLLMATPVLRVVLSGTVAYSLRTAR